MTRGRLQRRWAVGVALAASACFADTGVDPSDGGDDSGAGTGTDTVASTDTMAGTDETGASPGKCVGEPEDLVVNGGFEDWDDPAVEPVPWRAIRGELFQWAEPRTGIHALKLNGQWGGGVEPDGWALQQVIRGPFLEGDALVFSAHVRRLSGFGGGLTLSIDDPEAPGAQQETRPFLGSGLWEHFEVSFVLLRDVEELPLELGSATLDQGVVIDDARLVRMCDQGG